MLQMTRQMIFQDSASSLNPGIKVRDIVAEPLRIQSRKIRTDKREIEKQLEMVDLTVVIWRNIRMNCPVGNDREWQLRGHF